MGAAVIKTIATDPPNRLQHRLPRAAADSAVLIAASIFLDIFLLALALFGAWD